MTKEALADKPDLEGWRPVWLRLSCSQDRFITFDADDGPQFERTVLLSRSLIN